MTAFNKWLDTFLQEKGIDGEEILTVEGPSGENIIPIECLVDVIKSAPRNEQAAIKAKIVAIDFKNGDVRDFLKFLAKKIAR